MNLLMDCVRLAKFQSTGPQSLQLNLALGSLFENLGSAAAAIVSHENSNEGPIEWLEFQSRGWRIPMENSN